MQLLSICLQPDHSHVTLAAHRLLQSTIILCASKLEIFEAHKYKLNWCVTVCTSYLTDLPVSTKDGDHNKLVSTHLLQSQRLNLILSQSRDSMTRKSLKTACRVFPKSLAPRAIGGAHGVFSMDSNVARAHNRIPDRQPVKKLVLVRDCKRSARYSALLKQTCLGRSG